MKKSNEQLLFDRVDELLWKEWDPIGINDMGVRDEYRGYVARLVQLKIEKAGIDKISACLYSFETVDMGLEGNLSRCEAIARSIALM